MPIGINDYKVKGGPVSTDFEKFTGSQVDQIKNAINKMEENCEVYSRDPRTHHDYEKIDKYEDYTMYRKYVGKDLARAIFAVKDDLMVLIAILPKDGDTYENIDYDKRLEA